MTPQLFPIIPTTSIIPITPRLASTAPTCAPQMPLNNIPHSGLLLRYYRSSTNTEMPQRSALSLVNSQSYPSYSSYTSYLCPAPPRPACRGRAAKLNTEPPPRPGKPSGYPMTPQLFPIIPTTLIIPITPRLASTAPTCAPQMPLNCSCGITAQVPIPG